MTPRPDVVLATGDLTDHGTAEEYALLREILGALEVPLFLVPGNHDDVGVLRTSYGTPEYARDSFDYVVDDFPVRLIALDSTVVGRHDGEIDGAQLAWHRRDPRRRARPADHDLPAPPAVRDRHLVDGLHRAHRRRASSRRWCDGTHTCGSSSPVTCTGRSPPRGERRS